MKIASFPLGVVDWTRGAIRALLPHADRGHPAHHFLVPPLEFSPGILLSIYYTLPSSPSLEKSQLF